MVLFKCRGADIPQGGMASFRVIEIFDVIRCSMGCGYESGYRDSVNEFRLEGAKKAFHDSVVPTVTFAAHAANDTVPGEKTAIEATRVLHAAVGMVDEPAGWFSRPDGHP